MKDKRIIAMLKGITEPSGAYLLPVTEWFELKVYYENVHSFIKLLDIQELFHPIRKVS